MGPGSPLWCEYLSPWVLRKEVQNILLTDGIEALTAPEVRAPLHCDIALVPANAQPPTNVTRLAHTNGLIDTVPKGGRVRHHLLEPHPVAALLLRAPRGLFAAGVGRPPAAGARGGGGGLPVFLFGDGGGQGPFPLIEPLTVAQVVKRKIRAPWMTYVTAD